MDLLQTKTKLETFLSESIPGFQIVLKSDSKFMKFLSAILFFVKGFLTKFATTIYPKVYLSSPLPENPTNLQLVQHIALLAHEGQHMFDRKALWWFFNFAYLAPQVFAPLAFLAFVNPWWLLALAFLAPIPSIGRAIIEIRGYNVTIAAIWWMGFGRADIGHIVDNFCNGNYYFMFPFRSYLMKKFEKTFEMVKSDAPLPKYLERFHLLFPS